MSKTKKLTITTSDEATIKSLRNKTHVSIEEPDIEDMLMEVSDEDIVAHVRSNGFKPDEIFEHEELSEWAVSHGYIKE